MPIDLSGALNEQFRQAKRAHEKALASGDHEVARKQASRCARTLRAMADNMPERKADYLQKAAGWEQVASGAPVTIRPGQGKGERVAEAFTGQIEQLITESRVTWSDIGGLESAKAALAENVVLAVLKRPESIQPARGFLLFGPPGTGKTLLAAAAAGSLKATFFNAPASALKSKWYGETPKMIAALYNVARQKAAERPSIIFFDELDAFVPSRQGDISEAGHSALGELLQQMDGFKDKKSTRLVLTMAATNVPWELDEACLSRFPQRIYVPLPDVAAAGAVLKIETKDIDMSRVSIPSLAQDCVRRSFSGREISHLCQDAKMNMVRAANPGLKDLAGKPWEELRQMSLKVRPLSEDDFRSAFAKVKSAVRPETLERHRRWAVEFGR